MSMIERHKTAPVRPGHLSMRRQRIEHWAYKGRSVSNCDKATRSSASLGTWLMQKRSDNSLFQADRHLNMYLYQLGEERQKLLEQHNFDQKLFANKQALRHKDNQDILRTLNYVRKCCKYSEMNDNENELIDPTIFFEDNPSIRSRSLATVKQNIPLVETSLQDNDERHVQFEMNTKRSSQSAHISGKSRTLIDNKRVQSAHGIRIINSAPLIKITDPTKESIKTSSKLQRPSSRIFATKKSLQEFRRYPDRFLSKSNRYLPLLRHQATEIESNEFYLQQQQKHTQSTSYFSDGSDLAYYDAKSFLSEEIEPRKHVAVWDKHDRRNSNKLRAPNKIDLMETITDNTSEHTIALSRLRDLEYAHLQGLIRSNSIEHILKPLSSMKTLENKKRKSTNLHDILHSIDSLHCLKTINKRKEINIKKNLSKLGILIF